MTYKLYCEDDCTDCTLACVSDADTSSDYDVDCDEYIDDLETGDLADDFEMALKERARFDGASIVVDLTL